MAGMSTLFAALASSS